MEDMEDMANIATKSNVVTSKAKLAETVRSVRKLQSELNTLFPEREALITQLVYALLIKEHVLVFGTYGTGKSLLVGSFLGAFSGGNMFSIELTKFMTESNIVGIPNPKKMREDGQIFHETEGTMIDAHFAELDEILDANDHLLRTLLGILNERRFHRGAQKVRAKLHMALASTNSDPEEVVKRSPALGAVMDRFLFKTKVGYLTKDESRRRMYENFLCRKCPTVQIPYSDIEALAAAVEQMPINDPSLIELYDQIVQAFRAKKTGQKFSDRRACQALKLVKANALYYGRGEIIPDDFLAVRWVFCNGDDDAALTEFETVAKPLIDQAIKEKKPDVMATQMKLLEQYEQRLPQLVLKSPGNGNGNGNGYGAHTPDELVSVRREVIKLQSDVGSVNPTSKAVEDRQKRLLYLIEDASKEVNELIDGKGVV